MKTLFKARSAVARNTEPLWGVVSAEDAPQPTQWREDPPLRRRLWRSLSVSAVAATAVFVIALFLAIVTAWAQPHEIDQSLDSGAGMLQADAPDLFASADSALPWADVAATAGGDAGAHPQDSPRIFVHVVGEVHDEGVVELSPGSRTADAIEAAGGATPEAVLSAVNLARVLVDGEQILVPNAQQASEFSVASQEASDSAATGKINLNTADAAALQTLPRVGPALAGRILDWRNANGRFANIEQLLNVSGIGQKTFEGLRDLVSV